MSFGVSDLSGHFHPFFLLYYHTKRKKISFGSLKPLLNFTVISILHLDTFNGGFNYQLNMRQTNARLFISKQNLYSGKQSYKYHLQRFFCYRTVPVSSVSFHFRFVPLPFLAVKAFSTRTEQERRWNQNATVR